MSVAEEIKKVILLFKIKIFIKGMFEINNLTWPFPCFEGCIYENMQYVSVKVFIQTVFINVILSTNVCCMQ